MAILDKKLVQGWLDAWNAHDLNKTLGYYADDGLYESAGGTMVTIRSKKEMATVRSIDYDIKGKTLDSYNIESMTMKPIVPDTIAESIFNIVCKQKKGDKRQ